MVGECVGLADGPTVGELEGLDDGDTLGDVVGSVEGLNVGLVEGECDGDEVFGDWVGSNVTVTSGPSPIRKLV